MKIQGVYVPLITPFINDEIDLKSYKKMIEHYLNKGVSGFIPLGTTGEGPTISQYEYEKIIDKTIEYNDKKVPVFIGLGGNNTKEVVSKLKIVEKYEVDGILSVCPYYNRPEQRGIYEHFLKISQSTDLDIIIYNIPYRTGRNIENETIYKLAELKNLVGIKDSCGDIKQTTSLLLNPPKDFSILTGEDIMFYTVLTLGGDGGILAASHLRTEKFMDVYNAVRDNNHELALKIWKELAKFIPMLFEEANPAPLKYCLNKLGIIDSDEVRLPLTEVTNNLKNRLDKVLI
ncbi:4-hydroxy-tetrahydrodipicolinate synthase 2 [Clostridium zeae]|uniref:4-hydroxy-tetrahydrodipicolinate synthase n=1 Tax=Clostridium zeae TaxID=2759022 RepID=A0ABQ1EIH9_9CLOT|nr:4-hydroxy-tetrahydrodipicolinate synthase [Clostridium zeae]GFZ34550.1 4-hydroxy-tetrahydrodipicolinate synthase 2 [Clostridium zeae]